MKTVPITFDPKNLPDDLFLLKSLVADLVTELKNKDADIDKLRHQLHESLRRHYGRKSETVSPDQMALFQKLIEEQLAKAPKPPQGEAVEKVAVRGHGRRKPPKDLPKKSESYPLPDDQKTCQDCHGPLKKIGEETRNLIDYIPASVFVREQIAEKWACGSCQGKVVTSELPSQPIERCMAGDGMLAQVVTAKFCDHLPLYRQAEIFSRQGFEVNRSTLCGWTAQVADLLKPLVDAMTADILLSKVLHSDDTPVPVLESPAKGKGPPGEDDDCADDEPQGRRKARQGRLWTWVGDKAHPHIVFSYSPDRKGERPRDFLEGWKGFLQADAYPGYDKLYESKRGIQEVACWAHARRKFFECQGTDKERARTALAFIRALYDVEDSAKLTETARERQELRQKHAQPVLDEIKKWLDAQALVTLPKSAMGQAIGYALNQWAALCRYISDGDLAIDNNAAENALRCVALGRKNWLFAGSDNGGHRTAVLYSLVASCKRRKLDTFAYFRDVIGRVATHPQSKIRELLPAHWAPSSPENVA